MRTAESTQSTHSDLTDQNWDLRWPGMKTWAVQDAKSRFSHVIELARTEGPQTITRHGKPVVVLVAAEEFKKSRAPRETPAEFFSKFKGIGHLRRSKDLPRTL